MNKVNPRIINKRPPFWRLLKLRFPDYDHSKKIAVAFGNTVYSSDDNMDESFKVHEETHLIRQCRSQFVGVFWWVLYFISTRFRYQEELAAFGKQYGFILQNYNKNTHEKWLRMLGASLASPLYGGLKSERECAEDIFKVGMATIKPMN